MRIGAPRAEPIYRERFAASPESGSAASGTYQGSDEDWGASAEQKISDPQAAVAASHGQVGVRNSRGKGIDIHELLKREAFASQGADCDSHFEKNRPCPDAPHGSSNQYVILDSWVKDLGRSNVTQGVLSWNFMVQGVSGDQNVGVTDVVDTVVEMQIGAFTIPAVFPGSSVIINGGPGGVENSAYPLLALGYEVFVPPDPSAVIAYTFNNFPYIGRITIEVREIGLQSISQNGGIRYHFEADVVPIFPAQGTLSTALGTPIVNIANPYPVGLRVVPLPGFDTYIFTDPIKDIHGVSLVFRAIERPILLPPDVIIGAQVFTSFSIWPYLGLILPCTTLKEASALLAYFNYALGLTQIVITGASTGNAPIDNWLNQAPSLISNPPPGTSPAIAINTIDYIDMESQGINNVTSPMITLSPQVGIKPLVPTAPVVSDGIQIVPMSQPMTVRFTTARIRVPMRFKRMVQRLTNYQ